MVIGGTAKIPPVGKWPLFLIHCWLYYITIKSIKKPLPPANSPAVTSLWCLPSLSCVIFIFIPSFCHISSSSPNALLISVRFYPSHSDLYQIYSLMGWVVKWSGDTGEFYRYKWQLFPRAVQSRRLEWNMEPTHSGDTFHCNLLRLSEWI